MEASSCKFTFKLPCSACLYVLTSLRQFFFSLLVEAVIKEISEHIGNEWKSLAHHLQFSPTDIASIEYDNHLSLREQIHQFFYKWKRQQGPDASVEQLIEGLEAARLQEVLDSLEKAGLLPKDHVTSTITSQGPLPNDHGTNILPHQGLGNTLPVVTSPDRRNIVSELCNKLFDTTLYNLFDKYYNDRVETVVDHVLAGFFVYQFGIIALFTLCEDSGLQPSSLVVCMLKLALRALTRVITPLIFMTHLKTLADKPSIPDPRFTTQEDFKRLCKVHELFNTPRKVVREINDPVDVTEEVEKNRITSSWQIAIVNSILLTVFMYYLGTFVKTGVNEGTICDYLLYNPLLVVECIQTAILLFVVCIVKECYCYENRIAIYAVLAGKEGQKLYNEIRKRWYFLDMYCYCLPIGLSVIAAASYITETALIPEPKQEIKQSEIITWYFWTLVLSGLTFLISSSNRLAKHTVMIAYLLLTVFVYTLEHNGIVIPGTGVNSPIVFLYTTLAVVNINLILTLYRCNKYHHEETHKIESFWWMYFCLVSMFLLPLLVVFITSREVIFFECYNSAAC